MDLKSPPTDLLTSAIFFSFFQDVTSFGLVASEKYTDKKNRNTESVEMSEIELSYGGVVRMGAVRGEINRIRMVSLRCTPSPKILLLQMGRSDIMRSWIVWEVRQC